MLRKSKIAIATLMAICIVMVGVSMTYNEAKSLNTFNNNLNAKPNIIAVAPPPVVNSVNSSSNPAYSGQTVSFNASVNWEGWNSGSLQYYVANQTMNVSLASSSYVFNNPGNYTVVVSATTNSGTGWGSFTQVVYPFVILSYNVMDTPASINSSAQSNLSVNQSMYSLTPVNLTNSNSYISYGSNATLIISKGLANNMPAVKINFTMDNPGWISSIQYTLILNQTTGVYSGFLFGNLIPAVNPIHMGDFFTENFTSNVTLQLTGVENGINILASQYTNSGNLTLQNFGSYYDDLAQSFNVLIGMLPSNVSNLNVSHTAAIVLDYNFWDCLYALGALALATAILMDLLWQVYETDGLALLWLAFKIVGAVLAVAGAAKAVDYFC